jgi:preprotein translocase subunit SecG
MTLTILNVIYVLLAIFMIGFILVQRGPGAAAGSGFGAGASATVFGARGAASFLTRSTAVLATIFFLLTLGMAIYVSRAGIAARSAADLGVMGGAEVPTATAPARPAGDVPAVEPAATAEPEDSEAPVEPTDEEAGSDD